MSRIPTRMARAIIGVWLIIVGPSVRAETEPGHAFYFTRGIYTSIADDGFNGNRWMVDFPEADHHLLAALRRLSIIDAFDNLHPMPVTDPNLRKFPFLYMLELGYWNPPEDEIKALRNYLLAGGFLVVDDFWGSWAWDNFQTHMRRVLPDRSFVEVPHDHPIFSIFYNIDEIVQVPNVRQGQLSVYGGPTYEYDGYVPHVRGIFDDKGRLMVLVNWNTDLGDAWEWADDATYPLKFSNYAFEMMVNFTVYAMTY
ncbi:MAG: DUF4159 domain-containing protein [Gammaproteobacteria bacterium]